MYGDTETQFTKLAFSDSEGRRLFACSLSAMVYDNFLWDNINESDTVLLRTDGSFDFDMFEKRAKLFNKLKNAVFLISQDFGVPFMRGLGYNAHFLPESAFLRFENYPDPDLGCNRKFKAVLNASGSGFKRSHLLPGSKDFAVITYCSGEGRIPDRGFGFINESYIGRDSLFEIVSGSGCGLVLSFAEGIPRAMIEYLLCGIPVVSTLNVSGRDFFLNPGNSITCLPNQSSVVKAIDQANSKEWDRQSIRGGVINEISRLRLVVKDILRETPIGLSFEFEDAYKSLMEMDYMGGHTNVKVSDLIL